MQAQAQRQPAFGRRFRQIAEEDPGPSLGSSTPTQPTDSRTTSKTLGMASTLSMAEVASALPEGEAAEATPPDADPPIRAKGKACIRDLINHGGRNVLVHDVCSFMSGGVHDLKGALCACRAFLAVLPQVVRRLEGFERRRDGDRDGWQASNDVVCEAARRFTNVRFISLADCNLLTDVVLIAIAHSCPNLDRLNVANCRELTDAGLIAIAHHCPKLTKLCATSCKLRDPALIAIADNCPALAQLSVHGCDFVTSASIVEIAQNCGPNLTQLNLWACGKMTDEVSEDINGTDGDGTRRTNVGSYGWG